MGFARENTLPTKSITQEFNKSAADYRESFPEQLKNLFVATLTQPIYTSPGRAEELSKNTYEVKKMLEGANKHILSRNGGLAVQVPFQGEVNNYIFLKHSDPSQNEMERTFIFDHEMGHLVVKEGMAKPKQIGESAADAFAMLRHIQRFGNTTGHLENWPLIAAETITIGTSPIHYTSAAVQKVASIQKEGKIDIRSLSLKETAELAGKIAREYSPSDEMLKKISEAYKPAGECYQQEKNWDKAVGKTIHVMLENKNDTDIYRAGKLFLESPAIRNVIAGALKARPHDKQVFDLMSLHEKKTGFILNAATAIDAARTPKSIFLSALQQTVGIIPKVARTCQRGIEKLCK